ncbi:helix-turn-helix domain-containing protein [Streptomyces sp. NPDC057621]|uniref:helix-turn-helix domain-containing protein n=1 Tax=Streptomyces sp. NPDC057621 TaxID=3346186 RepID=UPI0036AC39A8
MDGRDGENPAIQRLRLRTELRRARVNVGRTQKSVAQAMEWSPSKLLRIEAGEVGISINDLRSLLALYSVTDEAEVDILLALARGSRKMPLSEYRDLFSKDFFDFLALESAASEIRIFEPLAIPGLLQTEEYAAEIIETYTPDWYSNEQKSRMIEARMLRQESLNRDYVDSFFIMDESVIRRQMGGLAVMQKQLRRLAELAAHPRRHIMIYPFSEGNHPASLSPFTLFDFAEGLDPYLYFESPRRTYTVERVTKQYPRYFEIFAGLEEKSIGGDRVPRILRQVADGLGLKPKDFAAPESDEFSS